MSPKTADYNKSVFINCPFDKKYKPIRDAIVFAVFECGFVPRCALEAEDEPQRLERILQMIEESRLSIHDLSRAGIDSKSRLARFNMPFELGVFLGAKRYGGQKQRDKSFAIFDKERYRYLKFISDLNGYDPKPHGECVKPAVKNVRNFIQGQSYVTDTLPGADTILRRHEAFKKDLPAVCRRARIRIGELTYVDYCFFIQEWLRKVAP